MASNPLPLRLVRTERGLPPGFRDEREDSIAVDRRLEREVEAGEWPGAPCAVPS